MKIDIKNYYRYYIELKNRFFLTVFCWTITTLICYYYKNYLLFVIIKNIAILEDTPYFIFTDISEIFYVYIHIIFFISNQIGFIILIYHILIFLILGLYESELKTFKILPSSSSVELNLTFSSSNQPISSVGKVVLDIFKAELKGYRTSTNIALVCEYVY